MFIEFPPYARPYSGNTEICQWDIVPVLMELGIEWSDGPKNCEYTMKSIMKEISWVTCLRMMVAVKKGKTNIDQAGK